MIKKIYFFVLMLSLSWGVYGDIEFSELELSTQDLLSFNMNVSYPGYGDYKTLLLADLTTNSLRQLTFFPEKIMYLADTAEFQIQNRFGVFRSDESLANFKAIDLFPPFVNTFKIERGKIHPIHSSPDGKYLTFIDARSSSGGVLTLFDVAEKKTTVVSENIEASLTGQIAIWSEDSSFIVYSKNNYIYYYSIEHLKENRVFGEELRKVGKGVLANVRWGTQNNLFYISDFLIYRIGSREFFTRALYKDILRIGSILGKVPFSFDPNFDNFWISPDGRMILLNKGGRNLFLYYLTSEDFVSTGNIQSLPYLYLPRNTSIAKVVWSDLNRITVLTRGTVGGKKKSEIFRLTIPASGSIPGFTLTDDAGVTDIELSPQENSIAVLKGNTVEIKTYSTWKTRQTLTHPNPIAAIWKSETELFVSGAIRTELYNITTNTTTLLALSQSGEKGFSLFEDKIIMKSGEQPYSLDLKKNLWDKASGFEVKEGSAISNSYRAYLTDSTTGGYSNMVMVRDIKADSFGTVPLFKPANIQELTPFPATEGKINFDHFTNGSRIRRREVAIVFNVIDSIEGLPMILDTLADYNLKCTFFINGEAIKRYSGAVKELSTSGHEIGSLFYAYFNMIDAKYNLDQNFIKLGLAINEDDYFSATGKELTLLWHAPYYFIDSDIIKASKEMGYIYIGRDVDAMDWVTKDISGFTTGIYLPAIGLVERILKEKQPGSIIPIQVGVPKGEREDYLFQKLDILINALLNEGYDIVPVSTLIENAR